MPKRSDSRPTTVVAFRIFVSTLNQVDVLAGEMGLARADALRTAVRLWIKSTERFLFRTRDARQSIVHHVRHGAAGPYSPCGALFCGRWSTEPGLLATNLEAVDCPECRSGEELSWSAMKSRQQKWDAARAAKAD